MLPYFLSGKKHVQFLLYIPTDLSCLQAIAWLLMISKYPAQLSWAVLPLALSHYLLNATQLLSMKIAMHFSHRVLYYLLFSVNTICNITKYRFFKTCLF